MREEKEKKKDHRVRLNDDEIKIIAEALEVYLIKMKGESKDLNDTWKIRVLKNRFKTWGDISFYGSRPFYQRRP